MTVQYTAIEITSPEIAEIIKVIKPELADRDYETELRFNFLVLGFPRPGESTLVLPVLFNKTFDHIVNGPQVMLKTFVKKQIDDDPTRKTQVRGRL